MLAPLCIDFYLSFDVPQKNLFCTLCVQDHKNTELITNYVNLADGKRHIRLEIKNTNPVHLDIKFSTQDPNIVNTPLVIDNIMLDDFFSSTSIVYSGKCHYDREFISYAEENKLYLDNDLSDSNCLNFTGSLVYRVSWPFYKNIFVVS